MDFMTSCRQVLKLGDTSTRIILGPRRMGAGHRCWQVLYKYLGDWICSHECTSKGKDMNAEHRRTLASWLGGEYVVYCGTAHYLQASFDNHVETAILAILAIWIQHAVRFDIPAC